MLGSNLCSSVTTQAWDRKFYAMARSSELRLLAALGSLGFVSGFALEQIYACMNIVPQQLLRRYTEGPEQTYE